MKLPSLLLLGAAAAPHTSAIVSVVVVLAAVLLTLNSLGVLPRGKTADRLKLDLEVSEKELTKALAELEVLRRQPNLDSHAQLLAAMLKSLQAHDTRMATVSLDLTKLAEKILTRLDLIEVAVLNDRKKE